ncbi:MAG: DUF3592 domain-containing protein [Eubacterium sp.]|nr:DUF3592 domain-containing protein [Eubacterium sp.]
MKVRKLANIFCGIFAAVGAFLVTAAVMICISDRKFMAGAEEISGVISAIETYRDPGDETHHRVYVDYTYNGQQYGKVRVNFYTSSMYEGKEITLYCDSRHPERVRVQGADTFAFSMFLVMGIIFLCGGIIPLIISIRSRTKKKKVRETGRMLYATVDEIDRNTNYRFNGKNPYVIICSYRDDHKDITYRFKSENLWFDSEPAVTVGSIIKVYVEENNHKNYYVDTESMIQGKVVDYT